MKRLVIDGSMAILFLLALCFRFLPKQLHEVLGIAFFLAAVIHLFWNRTWFASRGGGFTTMRGRVSTTVNILLIISTVAILVTGVLISHHLFKELIPLALRRNILLHKLHVSLPYYWLILAGLHLGFHWQGVWQRLTDRFSLRLPSAAGKLLAVLVPVFLLAAGTWGTVLTRAWDRLLMKHIFHTPAMQYPLELNMFFFIAILGMFTWLGFMAEKWLCRRGT